MAAEKLRNAFVLFFVFLAALLSAQEARVAETASSFSLETEVARLRERAAAAGVGAVEKRAIYAELGSLYKLSGDNESAALAWLQAANIVPNNRDDAALLESAACFMAIGYWEEAEAALKPVMLSARPAAGIAVRARYLAAQIEGFTRGDVSALESYLNEADYAALKPSLYYTLYIITKNNDYKSRLLGEYPSSPEARLLTDDATPFPGAMWLLYPGRDSITIAREN